VAIGWDKMGDLSKIGANREAFKSAILEAYPDTKPAAVPLGAGQPFRFLHEVKLGDLVVYPSKLDRKVHIGEVTGQYAHRPDISAGYPHQRAVKWHKHVARTAFSQGALYEIGSAMSLFQVRNYAQDFVASLTGKTVEAQTPVQKDETVKAVAEDIEQVTRDFVLKTLEQELKGHPLTDFVAQLLNTMGYRTRVSPPGPDGGIDIVAHKDELGFEPPIIKVQVKSSTESVGAPAVQALYGTVAHEKEYGLFVTLGDFSSAARAFAKAKNNLRLIDAVELVELVLEHYEQLDSRYKGILPLQRVYVPAPSPDEDIE